MENELTHTVQITVTGNYPHGSRQQCSIEIAGTGDLDHMIESFKAILVASGFSIDIAKKLDDVMDV